MDNNKPKEILPKTWIVESILISLFCFPPFGIIALIYASKVEYLYYLGEFELANRASNIAKKWSKIGFICGISLYSISIIFLYLKGNLGHL
jgi:hypothetical protein